MAGPWYATREDVKGALDYKETSRTNSQVDRALASATDTVEGSLNRVFHPTLATRYFDWPTWWGQGPSFPWRLWLGQHELISVTTIVAGGITIPASGYYLEPINDGPPYTRVESNLSSQYAFAVGSSHQRNIAIAGLYGYRNDESAAGILAASVSTTTGTTVDVSDSSLVGVGSLIRVDSERLTVTGKTMITTGQTGSLALDKAAVSLAVSDATQYHVEEVLLLDSERVRVDDISGNTLTVTRAWDGTVLAAHATATIYAPRRLTIERGVLGTTAATHSNAAAIARHVPPALVHELSLAETINDLLQSGGGYTRRIGSRDNQRDSGGELEDIRCQAQRAHGRQLRTRAV